MILKSPILAAAGFVLAGSCLTAALVAGAEAVPPPVAPTTSSLESSSPDPHLNAALTWWRALYVLNEEKARLGAVVDLDPLKAQLPDAAVEAVFTVRCRPLELLARGSANAYCDWGIDVRTEGVGALLPYLQGMRQLIRLSLLRARWHALGGRSDEAVDDLLVAQRTARLLAGRSPLIIDILAAYSTERQGIAIAGTILAGMPATQRQRLRTGLEGFPKATTVADALDNEVVMVHSVIDQLLHMPLSKRLEFLSQTGDSGIVLSGQALLPALTDERLREARRMYSEEVARWQKQMRLPLTERGAKLVMWSGGTPPHPLLGALAPAIEVCAASEAGTLQGRQQLQAAIAFLAAGDTGLAQYPDVCTGKPFHFEKLGDGFQLSAVVPGQSKEVVLRVGTTLASASPTSQPSDF